MMDKFVTYSRMQKNSKTIHIISLLVFSVSIMILSIMFYMNDNNEHLYKDILYKLNQGDITIFIENKENKGSYIFSKDQLLLLNSFEKEGLKVFIEEYGSFNLLINDELIELVVRFDDNIQSGKCILSNLAAKKLNCKENNYLEIGNINKTLDVIEIENSTMSSMDANFFGYIILSSEYIKYFVKDKPNVYNECTLGKFLNLRICIDLQGHELYDTYLKLSAAFDSKSNNVTDSTIRILTNDELEKEYFLFYETVNEVLLMLACICFMISSIGLMALLYLKANKQKDLFAILKVFGMGKKDNIIFAIFDTLILAFTSSVIGNIFGNLLFSKISIYLTGNNSYINILSMETLNIFIKCFIFSTIIIFFCNLPMHLYINNIDSISILHKRERGMEGSKIFIKWYLLGFGIFSLMIALFLEKKQFIIIIFSLFIFATVLYHAINLILTVLKKKKQSIDDINTLAYRLILNRKESTAMLGTTIVIGLIFVFLIYYINIGLENIFEKDWIEKQNFNVVVQMNSEQEKVFNERISENQIKYYKLYTKLINQNVDSKAFYFGIIQDDYNIVNVYKIKTDEFMADARFIYENNLSINDEYYLLDYKTSRLTKVIDNLGISPVSYSVLVPYEDYKKIIDDTFNVSFLFNLDQSELEQVSNIAKDLNMSVVTSKSIVNMLKEGMSGYVSLIYITCALLSVVILIFIFAVTYIVTWIRNKEFALYRVFGASDKIINRIIFIESMCLSVIALLFTTILMLGLINTVLYIFLGSYSISITLGVFLIVFTLIILFSLSITWIVTKINNVKSPIEVLRHD